MCNEANEMEISREMHFSRQTKGKRNETWRNTNVYVFSEWIVLQKHIRCMKCLNLYQMSEVVFFMLIGVDCSMSSLSVAEFGSWLVGDAGCVWITDTSFVVFAWFSVKFDVIVIVGDGGCATDSSAGWSSVAVVCCSFDVSSVAISMLIPLCFANNFNSSIASRASRFSCRNLF